MLTGTMLFSCSPSTANPTDTTKDTSADTDGSEIEDLELPEYDFEGADHALFLKLPEGFAEKDYSEGIDFRSETPSEAEIKNELIKNYLKNFETKSDVSENGVVEDLDYLTMTYVGKLNGEAFSGGSAENASHQVSIYASTFIDGFDLGLIGMKVGETKDLELTFPDPYQNNPDLAGKAVVFTVTVSKIERPSYPEITDQLILDNPNVFTEEGITAEKLLENVTKSLAESYKSENESLLYDACWSYLLKNSEVVSYPEGLVEGYVDVIVRSYELQYSQSIDQLAIQMGYLSGSDFIDKYAKPMAQDVIKESLMLYYVAEELEVVITTDEAHASAREQYTAQIEPNISFYSMFYGISDYESYVEYMGGIESYKQSMIYNAIIVKLCKIESVE